MKIKSLILLVLATPGIALAVIGTVQGSFPTPFNCPTGLATDGASLYLADRKSDLIYKIDPKSGKILDQLPAPGFKPYGLTFDGKHLWVVDAEENIIVQIDPATRMNIKTLPNLATGASGLAWDGQYLWVGDSQKDKLLQISTEDGTTIKELPSPAGDPTGLTFDGAYLWVADRITDMIYLVWPATGEVVLMFKSPGLYPWGLACIDKNLYCADYQSDSIYVVAADDDDLIFGKDKVSETLEYTDQFRNYGPGTILGLDIYLALPENSPHQTLTEPLALGSADHEIFVDKWGQKVARFHFDSIKSGQVVSASYKMTADIYDQWFLFRPERVGLLKDIPKDIKNKYLIDDVKFAIGSTGIKKAVKEAVDGESNPYWIMRKIFRYIINHMEYELAGGWNIAPAVLESGKGSCSEYSFVFISMCRAAGLPARYAGSITQRGDLASEDDVFHRWCEVYLPNIGWLPVDPSGGDQKTPQGQASFIGHVANKYLITTTGGGGSEYLGWEYNSNEIWQSQGICKTYIERLGEWSPYNGSPGIKTEAPAPPEKCQPK